MVRLKSFMSYAVVIALAFALVFFVVIVAVALATGGTQSLVVDSGAP